MCTQTLAWRVVLRPVARSVPASCHGDTPSCDERTSGARVPDRTGTAGLAPAQPALSRKADVRREHRVVGRAAQAKRACQTRRFARPRPVRGRAGRRRRDGAAGARCAPSCISRGARCEFVGAPTRSPGDSCTCIAATSRVEAAQAPEAARACSIRSAEPPIAILVEAAAACWRSSARCCSPRSALVRKPRTANWKEVAPTMERAGADAVPIVRADQLPASAS